MMKRTRFVWASLVAGAAFTAAGATAQNVVVVPPPAPAMMFDGHVSKLEYLDAKHFTFANGHGEVDVYAKVAEGRLCLGFVIPDDTVHMGDDMVVMLDTANSRQETPDPKCLRAYVRRKIENSRMHVGDGKAWVDQYGPWEYRANPYAAGWEMECRVPLSAIGVGGKTTLGFALRIWDDKPQKTYNWPAGSSEKRPATWGKLVLDTTKVLEIGEKP